MVAAERVHLAIGQRLAQYRNDSHRDSNAIDPAQWPGRHGGEIVYAGDARGLLKAKTATGKYLAGEKKIARAAVTLAAEAE